MPSSNHSDQSTISSGRFPMREKTMSIDSSGSVPAQTSIDARDYLASISTSSHAEQPATSNSDHTRPRILHWTSPESRLMEYAAIDRAHSGFRGLVKQLLPRSWIRHGHRKFFDGNDDGDSVRRHRIDGPAKCKRDIKSCVGD